MIQAIETRYAGCRFRSRLEARWAVLFDRLGISWQYEPQGYKVGADHQHLYLPDFWLPSERMWVEVKGDPTQMDLTVIVDAVVPHWGLPDAPNEHRMLILGPLPRPGGRVAHSLLTFYKGDVKRVWAEFGMAGVHETSRHAERLIEARQENWVGGDSGDTGKPSPPLTECLYLAGRTDDFITAAYAAARSARFEHGESGA